MGCGSCRRTASGAWGSVGGHGRRRRTVFAELLDCLSLVMTEPFGPSVRSAVSYRMSSQAESCAITCARWVDRTSGPPQPFKRRSNSWSLLPLVLVTMLVVARVLHTTGIGRASPSVRTAVPGFPADGMVGAIRSERPGGIIGICTLRQIIRILPVTRMAYLHPPQTSRARSGRRFRCSTLASWFQEHAHPSNGQLRPAAGRPTFSGLVRRSARRRFRSQDAYAQASSPLAARWRH